jgi:pyrroline-5-carboxylate reductase
MAKGYTIGFLGAGRMATGLAQGFIRAALAKPGELIASDVQPAAREAFSAATGAAVTASNGEVAAAPTLVVAVKPAQVVSVLCEMADRLTPGHLVISIAAGIPLKELTGAVPSGTRVVRVMPNTPALVGASATAFAMGAGCGAEDATLVQRLFGAVGVVFELAEPLLDAVTGLSGSGPAYAYLVIEALSDGGVAMGLPRDVATRLAAQTLLGASRMVLETGTHPAVLREQVTSPGGTTIDGLQELERGGVRAAMISAVRAAADKARRLGPR